MAHPKLFSAMLASLQMNQILNGEAFEEIASGWKRKAQQRQRRSLELTITTPLPISDTNLIALELIGWRALLECPEVVSMLPDGSLQMTAPTLGASSKSTHRTRCEWKEPGYWLFASAADHWSR